MVSRKTIENRIITAVPGMNENSMDCGLPFYKADAGKELGELYEKVCSVVFGFAEKMAEIAYGKN